MFWHLLWYNKGNTFTFRTKKIYMVLCIILIDYRDIYCSAQIIFWFNSKGWCLLEIWEWNKCGQNLQRAWPLERTISLSKVAEIKPQRKFPESCPLESREWYKFHEIFKERDHLRELYHSRESRWDQNSAKTFRSVSTIIIESSLKKAHFYLVCSWDDRVPTAVCCTLCDVQNIE